MCWSFEVSLATSFFEIDVCLLLYFRKRLHVRYGRRDRAYALLFICILLIEVLEIFMWLSINSEGKCQLTNVVATSLCYVVIIVQPVVFVGTFYKMAMPSDQRVFLAPLSMAAVTCLGQFLQFVWGSVGEQKACATPGPTGHLHWDWPIATWYDVLPNFYTYFLFIFGSCCFIKPRAVAASVFVVLALSLGITSATVHPSEVCSTWCYSAMVLLVYFVAEPYVWTEAARIADGGEADLPTLERWARRVWAERRRAASPGTAQDSKLLSVAVQTPPSRPKPHFSDDIDSGAEPCGGSS